MYVTGEGVLKDDKEALKWFREAAEQGHAAGQGSLGYMYYEGNGVPKDWISAYAWFNLSAINGDEQARRIHGQVAKKMTPVHRAKGQELAKELLKKIEANKK